MSDCRRTADRLASYVDRLLPADEQAAVDHHLGVCASCRTAADLETGAHGVLRARAASLRGQPLPPGLRSRCESLAREHADAGVPFWRRRLVPLSLTAVLVFATVFAVFSLATRRSNTVFAGKLTADLIRCVMKGGGPETASADADRLESVLLEQYGWNVHVPPSSATAGD